MVTIMTKGKRQVMVIEAIALMVLPTPLDCIITTAR